MMKYNRPDPPKYSTFVSLNLVGQGGFLKKNQCFFEASNSFGKIRGKESCRLNDGSRVKTSLEITGFHPEALTQGALGYYDSSHNWVVVR
jgi:hypothetical protein